MIASTLDRYVLAKELLELKARISIIENETALSATFLRKAFYDMHQKSPPSGPLVNSPSFLLRNFVRLKEATLFVFFYRVQKTTDLGLRRSIMAYQRYASYIETLTKAQPMIDYSSAYMIVKWVESGEVKLVRCGHCRSAMLLVPTKGRASVCCVCGEDN